MGLTDVLGVVYHWPILLQELNDEPKRLFCLC